MILRWSKKGRAAFLRIHQIVEEMRMQTAKVRSAYQKSEAQAQIHPVKLIHLLYERVLIHLELAEQGIAANDVKARGENLSKAIAIIAELNASIMEADDSEAARFLRSLYSAILMELPKVSISNDVEIIRKSHRYLHRLLEIWESTAMVEAGMLGGEPEKSSPSASGGERFVPEKDTLPGGGDYGIAGPKKFKAMDAAACYKHGVSVSI